MQAFLASEIPSLPADQCHFHVICAPIEQTVSYGKGTVDGPRAILDASDQLEAFDGVSTPCERGIHTIPTPCRSLEEIERIVANVYTHGHFPFLLGGEHTVTLGALRALKNAGETFGIIQFDAHADLRDDYEGSTLSHACVMRRAIDDLDLPIYQIGVRALSIEEHTIRQEKKIGFLQQSATSDCLTSWRFSAEDLPDDFPDKVYITFDVDALDPSVMPSTGTPVPDGLMWREAFHCLQCIAKSCNIIAADVVELAPIDGLHAPDFGAATLVYRIMGLVSRASNQ
jgi:agmatinase